MLIDELPRINTGYPPRGFRVNHDFLMHHTADMPMRTIQIGGSDYLQRYFAGNSAEGGQWWYHRFMRADAERHLHSHPWSGTAILLCGRYIEQLRPYGQPDGSYDRMRTFRVGKVNQIYPSTLHRIVDVEANTWTLLYVEPGRQPEWKFIGDDGAETIMQASPEDWHTRFQSRSPEAA